MSDAAGTSSTYAYKGATRLHRPLPSPAICFSFPFSFITHYPLTRDIGGLQFSAGLPLAEQKLSQPLVFCK